jgi:hypothetical protein
MLSWRSIFKILALVPVIMFSLGITACGSKVAAFSPLTVLSLAGGNVHILKTGSNNWSDGKEGMTLETGYKIKTDSGSKATITFFDGSVIELNGDTEISLDQIVSKSGSSSKIIKIGQEIGETTSRVVKLVDPASRYEVETPAGVAGVRGSTMVVNVAKDGTTQVYNVEGTISLTARGKEVVVPAGSSSSVKVGDTPGAPQPGLPPGSGSANATSISSRSGWQQTGLQLNAGDTFYVEYKGGSWTVDYRNFPYVGLAGYSSDIDKTIAAGYKFDSSKTYGHLLGKVGNGKVISIGSQGGPFKADTSGSLFLRINDLDTSLGDNDGAVTVGLRSSATPSPISSASSSLVALNVPVSGSGGFNYTQGSYLEGFEFTVKKKISITHLGAYDSNYSRLPDGNETFAPTKVALYNITTHTLLDSVTVQATDHVTGIYHYAALSTPIALNVNDHYAVVWVSGTNKYIASPSLTMEAVNSVLTYVGFAGHGPDGLTQTKILVEPDWFYTELKNGISALNFDLGPNFMFVVN